MEQNYISTAEAADLLGVSRVTIFNMIQDGRIEAMKVGRNYIIEKGRLKRNFIKDLIPIVVPILKKHDVRRSGIFGSAARGQTRKKSDVDILIEYKRNNKSLFDLIQLKHELEDALGREVDLITYDSLHHLLKERILKEEIPIL